jgi:hypothetical protein
MTRALLALALLALVGCLKPAPTPATLTAYPRVAVYGWLRGNGAPFSIAGVIDSGAVRRAARYDVAVWDVTRRGRSGVNGEAIRLLRSYNPSATLLALVGTSKFYVCGPTWYGGEIPYGCDTTQFAWSRFRAVQHFDGLLYGADGPLLGGGFIDYTRRGLPEALADTVVAWLGSEWSGVFSDESCLGWLPSGGEIDFHRSGFFSLAEWWVAYDAGVERYFSRLRKHLGPDKLIVGNCGPRGSKTANGWLLENFPWQPGGSIENYLAGDTFYAAPRLNSLTAWARSGDPGDPYNQQRSRFVLASATLGSGHGSLTWDRGDPARGWVPGFWWDELSVTPEGKADTTGAHKGWLGRPLGPPYRHLGAWRRDFEHGAVLVNPSAQAVKLGGLPGLYRLRGVLAPGVNSGAAADGTMLPAGDGLFLWRRP